MRRGLHEPSAMRSARLLTLLTALTTLAVMVPLTAGAQQKMVPGNIRAVKVEGTAWQTPGSGGSKERLREGAFLKQGATVETAGNGNVILLFDNGSTMQIRPGTKFSISEFLIDPFDTGSVNPQGITQEPTKSVTQLFVHEGTITGEIAKLNRSSTYNIGTPLATAGIRGTILTVQHSRKPPKSTFTVKKGKIQVTKKGGASWMASGEDDPEPDQNSETRTATDKAKQDVIIVVDGEGQDDSSGFGGYTGGVNLPAGFGGGGGGGGGGQTSTGPAPTPIPTPTPVKPYNP